MWQQDFFCFVLNSLSLVLQSDWTTLYLSFSFELNNSKTNNSKEWLNSPSAYQGIFTKFNKQEVYEFTWKCLHQQWAPVPSVKRLAPEDQMLHFNTIFNGDSGKHYRKAWVKSLRQIVWSFISIPVWVDTGTLKLFHPLYITWVTQRPQETVSFMARKALKG